jgi:hypothetical protein
MKLARHLAFVGLFEYKVDKALIDGALLAICAGHREGLDFIAAKRDRPG